MVSKARNVLEQVQRSLLCLYDTEELVLPPLACCSSVFLC